MTNLYERLNVPRAASAAEIKKAYRKLAKKYHPDLNQGDKSVEQKFKSISTAYNILSDTTKRARYDRGEIDEEGQEKAFNFRGEQPFRGRRPSYGNQKRDDSFSYGEDSGLDDILSRFFGQGGHYSGGAQRPKGGDITYSITIPFAEACLGATKRVTLDDKKTIDVKVPPGIEDGHKLRLRGLGQKGSGGAGDAIIDIRISPHPWFKRDGNNIHLDVPISLSEAVLGGSISIPTLDGTVSLSIPKGSNTDKVMRLKGKGVLKAKDSAGDMFVKLKIVLPADTSSLTSIIEKWSAKNSYNPRKW